MNSTFSGVFRRRFVPSPIRATSVSPTLSFAAMLGFLAHRSPPRPPHAPGVRAAHLLAAAARAHRAPPPPPAGVEEEPAAIPPRAAGDAREPLLVAEQEQRIPGHREPHPALVRAGPARGDRRGTVLRRRVPLPATIRGPHRRRPHRLRGGVAERL